MLPIVQGAWGLGGFIRGLRVISMICWAIHRH